MNRTYLYIRFPSIENNNAPKELKLCPITRHICHPLWILLPV
jgi:hypothetical protein